MSVPTYPDYKDSGIDRIGALPAHWAARPIKSAFGIFGGATPKSENESFWGGDVVWITPGDLSGLGSLFVNDSQRRISQLGLESCAATLVPAGSIILSTRAPIGSLAITTVPACSNQGCKALVPRSNASALFAAYALSVSTEALNVRGRGSTFLELSANELGAFKLALPPVEEQTAIASFLDRETAKIDELVEEQRRLIALLKEKRQAVISHAVTKGLDPDVPMEDSGVEWLGEVPAHWEVAPLKRHWSVTDCKHLTADFVDDGIPLASIREVQSYFVNLDTAKQTTDVFYAALIEGGRQPEPGDLIFSRNATVGEVAQVAGWHPPFAMGQDVCLLRRSDPASSPDFLQLALRSRLVTEQLATAMIGSTFKRVNVEEIRNLTLVFPPTAEQADIMRQLQSKVQTFDVLNREAESAIALLQERRNALISAAVTGKIDVRGLVTTTTAQEAA